MHFAIWSLSAGKQASLLATTPCLTVLQDRRLFAEGEIWVQHQLDQLL
jgi:hypothetical protein